MLIISQAKGFSKMPAAKEVIFSASARRLIIIDRSGNSSGRSSFTHWTQAKEFDTRGDGGGAEIVKHELPEASAMFVHAEAIRQGFRLVSNDGKTAEFSRAADWDTQKTVAGENLLSEWTGFSDAQITWIRKSLVESTNMHSETYPVYIIDPIIESLCREERKRATDQPAPAGAERGRGLKRCDSPKQNLRSLAKGCESG